jgi:hypothetical protein
MYGLALLKIRPDTGSFEAHPFTVKRIHGSNILNFIEAQSLRAMVSKSVKDFCDDATGDVGCGFAVSDVSGVNLDCLDVLAECSQRISLCPGKPDANRLFDNGADSRPERGESIRCVR